MKLPGEILPGASWFTSIDRRLPSWMNPSMTTGATTTRGTVGRVKFIGRYGTVAVAIAGFSFGYVAGASGVCLVQCSSR